MRDKSDGLFTQCSLQGFIISKKVKAGTVLVNTRAGIWITRPICAFLGARLKSMAYLQKKEGYIVSRKVSIKMPYKFIRSVN